jgi:glycosyltransferase involved in cell wall biosynthesis
MLSVIIPSRNVPTWPFVSKTIDGLFEQATGDVEVVIVLDGYEPNPPLQERDNLTIIHNNTSQGMRVAINQAVSVAKGKYVMKTDDHCKFSEGYDVILAADCDDNWLAVPARYSLDGQAWLDGKENVRKYGPIHHLYLTYPFRNDEQFSWGMHGKKWMGEYGVTSCNCCRKGGYFHREEQRKNILIDDILSIQGSCWFMPRQLFHDLDCMQVQGYGDYQEAQELIFKVSLSGGRCVVNKNAWYAHLHKGSDWGRGYSSVSYNEKRRSEIYSTDFWLNNKWPKQIKTFKELIENPLWWPMDLWPTDWDNPEMFKKYDYSSWLRR